MKGAGRGRETERDDGKRREKRKAEGAPPPTEERGGRAGGAPERLLPNSDIMCFHLPHLAQAAKGLVFL